MCPFTPIYFDEPSRQKRKVDMMKQTLKTIFLAIALTIIVWLLPRRAPLRFCTLAYWRKANARTKCLKHRPIFLCKRKQSRFFYAKSYMSKA